MCYVIQMANIEGTYCRTNTFLRTLYGLSKLIFITIIWSKNCCFPNITNSKSASQPMCSQRVGHDWVIKLSWNVLKDWEAKGPGGQVTCSRSEKAKLWLYHLGHFCLQVRECASESRSEYGENFTCQIINIRK